MLVCESEPVDVFDCVGLSELVDDCEFTPDILFKAVELTEADVVMLDDSDTDGLIDGLVDALPVTDSLTVSEYVIVAKALVVLYIVLDPILLNENVGVTVFVIPVGNVVGLTV